MAFLIRNIRRPPDWFRRVAATVVFTALALVTRAAPAPPAREFELKAATLYNIIAFTDWPATSFASPDAPLIVGVLGQGPVEARLDQFVANEMWHGRRILLRRYSSVAEAKNCHALYIARSEHGRWRAISGQFARLPILTVSDAENFARQGGGVQLTIDRNKLRLTVNLAVTRANGLGISSKVLRLADVIDDRGP